MAVTLKGIVYYAEDPQKRVFRVVHPEFDDAELDHPPTDGKRQPMRDEKGNAHAWHSFHVHPALTAVFEKISAADLGKHNFGGMIQIEKELMGGAP